MKMTYIKKRSGKMIEAALCISTLVGVGMAADWPKYLGPNGDAVSVEKGLLRAWPEKGPKVLWTNALGTGYGGAAIQGGKVYTLDRVNQQQDVLRCLDLATGKEEWNFSYDAPGAIDHDGSRNVPAVTEKFVYIIGPFGQFHCLDKATHQAVWQKNLLSDFGTRGPRWAVTQSPLPYKDMIIVAPQAKDAGVVAYDQTTGKERWRSAAIGQLSYPSPMLTTIASVDQVTVVNSAGVSAVSAADGKLLWKYAHRCNIPVPGVTPLGNGKLFVTGGYNAGSAIIQVSRQADEWTVKELARIDLIGGHCHPPIVYQGHLYMLCNTNERADGLVCFDFEGKVLWQTKRNPYLDKGGSLLTGDGLIYLMDGEKGELYIIEPSPEAFKPLSKVKLLSGRQIWGPLALANGKLLIRDQKQMQCVVVKE